MALLFMKNLCFLLSKKESHFYLIWSIEIKVFGGRFEERYGIIVDLVAKSIQKIQIF
jgi:hypothetical protein